MSSAETKTVRDGHKVQKPKAREIQQPHSAVIDFA